MIMLPIISNKWIINVITNSMYTSFLDFMWPCYKEYKNSQDSQSYDGSESRFPVTIVFCGSNLYRSSLRDVDGFAMQDSTGKPYNVFSKSFAQAIFNEQVRLIHRIDPGYRYFITSHMQCNTFTQIRNEGWSSSLPGVCVYLYDDEDCNYMSDHFKGAILAFE